MLDNFINNTLQSKNFVMFITSVLYMAGILTCFNNCEILASVVLSLIAIVLICRKNISMKYILFWIVIFYIGFFNANLRVKTCDDLSKLTPVDGVIEGQVVSIPNNTDDKIKFFANINSLNNSPIKSKSFVTLSGNTKDINIGDNIKIKAKIRQPFKATNPSQFDYGKYLRNFNAYTTIYAETENCEILTTKLSLKWMFIQHLNKIRKNIITTHSKYLQSPNLEILGGIVFGDDAIAPPDYIKTTFVNSGLLHILAASGMNVAFIFGFWFFIMRFFKIPYKINIIGGIVMVILYTLMTGLGASVLRAALMLLFIQIGKLIDRDAHSIALLSFVAMILLIYNPAYINDVGFQLSFVVTFGLLTTAKVIFEKLSDFKYPEWIKAGLLIPIIAQIWVAPIQMFYFNTVSTYSILANILTVPFLSVVSFGGFVSSILATIKPISNFICFVFDYLLKYALDIIVFISNYFAQLPHSIIQTTHPSVFQIFLYYFIILLLTCLIKFGYRKKILKSVILISLTLLLSIINIPNKDLEIITFDVKNADAFLIKSPENKYFIIDTAKASYNSKSSTAKLVICKYLKDKGIKNIEGLILTHFDLDHAGGAVDILNDLKIKNVYVNSLNENNYTSHLIFKTLKEKHIKPKLAQNNDLIYSEDNFNLKTYISKFKNNDNENSIITLLSYKDFDMIFMGDAGVIGFDKIKKDIKNNIEILKVGHHGGRFVVNKEMLTHINNNVSIISTGPNTFGHPNKTTLDILKHTDIYRTDKHNSIKIKTDGIKYTTYTFNTTNKKYEKQLQYKSY